MGKYRYPLDYYIKGIDLFTQRTIWEMVADRITDRECEMLIDEENGYANVFFSGIYRNMTELSRFLDLMEKRFNDVNEIMIKQGRYPLFECTKNLYECAKFRKLLVAFLPEGECNRIVGCESYYTYEPSILK